MFEYSAISRHIFRGILNASYVSHTFLSIYVSKYKHTYEYDLNYKLAKN
jgi:hypothetical protein